MRVMESAVTEPSSTEAEAEVVESAPSIEEEAKEEPTEEERKKYANWPLKDIKEPHPNDVLYGRGGTLSFL